MFASKKWTLDLTRKVVREAKKDRPVYFDSYSENEIIIGQWLDGKPIYQLTITGLNFGEIKATAGLKYTNNLFVDIDRIISSHINRKNLDETYVSLGVNVFCSHKLAENFIYIYSGVPFSKGTELTLQYTKVSDAPNSFNPSMIKANKIDYQVDNLNVGFQDYSESEIIVGRWIDGKPLYRKVVYVNNLANNTTKTVSCNIGANIIDQMVKQSLIWYDTVDKDWSKDGRWDSNTIRIEYNYRTSDDVIWINSIGTNWTGRTTKAYAILEYTKTTD